MRKFYFLFTILLIQTNSQIISNPVFLVKSKNPFVHSKNDDYYYLLTTGYYLKIKKDSGKIVIKIEDNKVKENCLIIENIANDDFLLCLDNYYKITYSDSSIRYDNHITINSNYGSHMNQYMKNGGVIKYNNNINIYGAFSSIIFFLINIKDEKTKTIDTSNVDKMSCKFIKNQDFICGLIYFEFLHLFCFGIQSDESITFLKEYKNDKKLIYPSISSLGLYDTDENNIKLLCYQKYKNINCDFIQVTIMQETFINDLKGDKNISFTISNNFLENSFYLSQFNKEYLFCCGITDYIQCYRINRNSYNVIKQFKILISGENSFLTLKINKNSTAFFFMNNKNNEDSIYGYYIFLPSCKNKDYIIHLNEKQSKYINDKLNNLFEIKTNNYYFEIKNRPDDKGYFNLNNNKIMDRTLISNNDYILNFIVTNNYISDGTIIYVKYIISIEEEEAYSKECTISITFKKTCYHSCQDCSKVIDNSDDKQHNCLSCKNNYYQSPENSNNCYLIKEKKINWYFAQDKNKFFLCDKKCSCSCSGPTIFDCLQCSTNLNNNNEFIDLDIELTEFENKIKGNINPYVDPSRVFNGTNFLAMIIPSNEINPEEKLKKGLSTFDLGNCINNIKNHYNIKKEENLFIIEEELKNQKYNNDYKSLYFGKDIKIEIYDHSSRKLDLSVCQEDIKIMKYIGPDDNLNINKAKILSNQGIDIFNSEDDFFNDICHPYDDPNGKDIIINDRRNEIYQNVTFCQNGCSYLGINTNFTVVNCLCNPRFLLIEESNKTNINSRKEKINFKNIKKAFIENLFNFNLKILKCYNLVLNKKFLIHNIGFYCMSSMFVLQIIFFVIYLIKKLKPIIIFMLKFKIKKDIKKYQIKNKKINIKKIKKVNFNNNKKNNKINSINNLFKKINNNNKKKKSNNKKRYYNLLNNKLNNFSSKRSIHSSKNPKSEVSSKKINLIQTININKSINNIKFETNKKKQIKLFYSNIQELDYKKAIIYDKRSYIKIYWGFLINSQIILETIFNNNKLDLFIIKLSFLVFTFQISFFLNAFFYTDEYISEAYHNNEVLDFISGLPKSIYSFISSLLITNLLKLLSSSKNELINIIANNRKFYDYAKIVNIKISKLRKKIIIYFILVILFESFFLYYVTVFCAVYRYSQKYWFLGCLESFAMDFLFVFVICLFLALFRYISIKKHIKCLYIFIDIIGIFL